MNQVKLTYDRLSAGAVTDELTHSTCGAVSLFVGTTRDNFEDKKVISLEYEAYEPMAIKEMTAICEEIRTRWVDVVNIAIVHRLGIVPEREASVIIGVSSPHRKSALDAVAFAIEELKRRVPIWKKELYEEPKLSHGKRKSQLDFNECKVEALDVPSQLIQIGVAEDELQRRIKCFVEKKREEININNIMDFTTINPFARGDDITESSARTMASIVKLENSKCHLRVRRVENIVGPQTDSNYTNTLDNLLVFQKSNTIHADDSGTVLHDRLKNIENYLTLKSDDTKNVYARIQAIERRILFLESISPEYIHFLDRPEIQQSAALQKKCKVQRNHKTYTIQDLDSILAIEQPPTTGN